MRLVFLLLLVQRIASRDFPQITEDYLHKRSEVDASSLSICFIFISLGIGSVLKEIAKKTRIPYTPMLFGLGIAWGYYNDKLGVVGQASLEISKIDPHGILIIFLPVLVYESGFNFDWHIFKRLFVQIIVLAFPCVFLLSFFIQFSIKLLLKYQDDYYTWESAFMFGSILSTTDTVAVLALLKECGAGRRLTSLIEGESLLNDGASMVLFIISLGIVKGTSQINIYQITSMFIQLTFGGALLGLIFGIISVYWIKRIFNDETLVLNITIVSCYMVFFVAEYVPIGIRISGIIALVSLSLFMSAFGRTRISREADKAIHEFWEYVVFASETVIFLLAGIIVSTRVLSINSQIVQDDIWKLGILWVCLMFGRFLSIAIFMPWLVRTGYGLAWKEVIVLTYGGIRGAVGITFALLVVKDQDLPEKLKDIVIFQMSGIALLTVIFNGTTLSFLVRALGLSTQSIIREKIYADFLAKLEEVIEFECEKNAHDKYLKEVQWEEVKALSGLPNYHKKQQQIRQKIEMREKKNQNEQEMKNISISKKNEKTPQQELLIEESEAENEINLDLLIELRRIFLMTLKGIYRHLFETNQCSPDSLILLVQSANLDLDNDKEHMNSWDFLVGQFSERYINSLFYMKDWWIIGRLSKNFLFIYIFYIYDVVSSYIEALDILKSQSIKFNFSEPLILEMLSEVEDNRKSAVQYIKDYLEVSFPEISRELHTKKAAFQVLEFEKSIIKQNLLSGQLQDKEYRRMKGAIDKKVNILNEMNPTWELPDLFEAVSKHELFKPIQEAGLRKLISECREESFGRDQIIYKEGERVNEVVIIMRGAGSEYSDRYKIREKCMLGDVTPVYMLVAPSIRYQTSFVADCVINATFFKVAQLQQLMKQVPQFEEQVWKYSLHALSRIYHEQLKPLCFFTKSQIRQVIESSTFTKIKRNQLIHLQQGAIILKGGLTEAKDQINQNSSPPFLQGDLPQVVEEKEQMSQEEAQDKSANGGDSNSIPGQVDGWKREAIQLIGPQKEPLKTIQNTLLLIFKDWSQLTIINQVEGSNLKMAKTLSKNLLRSQD